MPKAVIYPAKVYFSSRVCEVNVKSKLISKNRQSNNKKAGIKKGPIKRKTFDTHSNSPFFCFFGATLPYSTLI